MEIKRGNNVEIAIGWRSKWVKFEWRSKEATMWRYQLDGDQNGQHLNGDQKRQQCGDSNWMEIRMGNIGWR